MRFTNKFPYTNINNINLDWIIKRVKELGETVRSYANDIANAVALAEAAQDAADSVTGTAESAVATAQAAEATANAIAGTANSALATAQAANTTAQAAEATADAIAGTANSALSTAQAANTTAQAANATAQAAEESADNAETIAGTASANASNAVQTANTALATAQTALAIASQFDESALNEKAGSLVDTETGAVVTFLPDRTIPNSILNVSVAVMPLQAGTGTPAPNNDRLISGWNAVGISAAGVNLANIAYGGQIPSIATGQMVSIVGWCTDFISVDNAKDYYVSFGNRDTSAYVLFYDKAKQYLGFISSWSYKLSGYSNWGNTGFVKLRSDIQSSTANPLAQLEIGSSASAYHAYSGATYAITLGQTVYGGTLDVTNGTMTVEFACDSALWGDMTNSAINTNTERRRLNFSATGDGARRELSISNIATYINSTADVIHYQMAQNGNYAAFYLPLDTPATTQVQIFYPLATPFEIRLDPVQIAAIAEQLNNVWSNAGNVTVEFAADLKWYIDNKIAEVQALALENGG